MDNYSVSVGDYKFTLSILIEKKPDGSLIGTVIGLPDCQAEGCDRQSVMLRLREIVKARLETAEIIPLEVEPRHAHNPWLKFAGSAKKDPYFDEVLAHIEAYRRELDAEMEEYYRKLDAEEKQTESVDVDRASGVL